MGRSNRRIRTGLLIFIGTFSATIGLERCASGLDFADTSYTGKVCAALNTSSQFGGQCMTHSTNYFQKLHSECAAREGYQISTPLANIGNGQTGTIMSKKQFFSNKDKVLTTTWRINPLYADISQRMIVSFRYFAEKPVTAKIVQEQMADIYLELNESNGEWCSTKGVSMFAVSSESNEHSIILKISTSSPEIIHVDGIVVLFDDGVLEVAAQQIAAQHGRKLNQLLIEEDVATANRHGDCGNDRQNCSCVGDFYMQPQKVYIVLFLISVLLITTSAICWLRALKKSPRERGDSTSSSSTTSSLRKRWLPFSVSDPIDIENNIEEGSKETGNASPQSIPRKQSKEVNRDSTDIKRVQLIDILKNESLRSAFISFVKNGNAPEYMMFYETIETYENVSDRRWRENEAKHLISRYVLATAPCRVPLQPDTIERIVNAKSFPKNLFDTAKIEVYNIMQVKFLQDFLYSKAFKSSQGEEAFTLSIS